MNMVLKVEIIVAVDVLAHTGSDKDESRNMADRGSYNGCGSKASTTAVRQYVLRQ